MKRKLFSIISLAAAIAFAFVSCSKPDSGSDNTGDEPDTPDTPDVEYSKNVDLTFSLSEDILSTGFVFQAGDVITWVFADESADPVKIKLAKKNLNDDGASATVTAEIEGLDKGDVEGYFVYNQTSSANANFSFVEGGTSLYIQSEPNVVNRKYVHLHSGMEYVKLVAGEATATVDMKLAGTIFNVLPYTPYFNDENIQLVEIKSETNFLGTVQYKRETGEYKVQSTTKSVKIWADGEDTSIECAFPLTDALDEASALGFLFAVPASKSGSSIPEYTITVQTDKRYYEYVYTDALVVEENKVVNIPLCLDEEHRSADPDAWYNCDIVSGWYVGVAYGGDVYCDEEEKTQGNASIALDNFDSTADVTMFYYVCGDGYDTECSHDGLHLCFDFYVSDASKLLSVGADSQVELTSSDVTAMRWDNHEVHWFLHTRLDQLKSGWNSLDLPISEADAVDDGGDFDPSHVTLFRIYYTKTDGPINVKIDNIHFYDDAE